MFGSDAAYNLNNTQLVWNNDAPSVFVYFNVDESISENGSWNGGFGSQKGANSQIPESKSPVGYFVLTGVIGFLIGVCAAIAVVVVKNKKKNDSTEAG